jgi:histidine triad (HIT) family protein
MECLFCKISNKTLPSQIIFEDDQVLAFNDLRPQAPHHILIIPKHHISTINALNNEDIPLIGHMMLVAKQLTEKLGIHEEGYRLVFNCNERGGQEVYHLHMHLLGGRQMHWPPG